MTANNQLTTTGLEEQRSDTDYFLAGAIAGSYTRCLCQPFDVLKIRFQLQLDPITSNCDSAKYSGIKQAAGLIYREEGLAAFWKGHLPAQVLSILYGSLQFYIYEYTKDNVFHKRNDVIANFTCGVLGGGGAMAVAHPFDVIRTRLVAQGEPKTYNGMIDAMRKMRLKEGPNSFYKGFLSNILQISIHTGISFTTYKWFQADMEKIPYIPTSITSGALAGCVSKAMVYPLDLIKKRLQVQGFRDKTHKFGKYSGLIGCAKTVINNEGVLGLFKGFMPSCFKAMATSACQFSFYELALLILTAKRHERMNSNDCYDEQPLTELLKRR